MLYVRIGDVLEHVWGKYVVKNAYVRCSEGPGTEKELGIYLCFKGRMTQKHENMIGKCGRTQGF